MYRLPDVNEPIDFPDRFDASKDGLLAIGGNLRPETLLNAYRRGIFPWSSSPEELLWWHPHPRLVLFPEKVHLSSSLRKLLRKVERRFASAPERVLYRASANEAFDVVIRACAETREVGRESTWLNDGMIDSYTELHKRRFAQSIEVWDGDGALKGGLYGVTIGKVFFGESMFSAADNASKIALAHLSELLVRCGYQLIDCQLRTSHLVSMGAESLSRERFLSILKESGDWAEERGAWLSG